MRILFAIAVLSCCALIWAAISMARHVRKGHQQAKNDPDSKAPVATTSHYGRMDYSDPPVGGRRGKLHPREDLAAGQVASRSHQRPAPTDMAERRSTASASSSILPAYNAGVSRPDRMYYNRNSGDLSDPDTTRISGILPSGMYRRH